MEVVERFGTLVLMVMILCVYKVSVDKVILNYSKSLVTQGVYLNGVDVREPRKARCISGINCISSVMIFSGICL